MKAEYSNKFEIKRGLKSVAPSRYDDFTFISSQQINVDEIYSLGTPIIYSFSESLDSVALTLHDDVHELFSYPFFFQGQIKHAKGVVKIQSTSLESIFQKKRKTPIFLVSPGRVGSTLVSNILKYGGVECLSEPDALSSFKLRNYNNRDQSDKQQFKSYLKQTICSYGSLVAADDYYIVKLRSYSSSLVPLMSEIITDSKYIFMFRNVSDWAISMIRTFNYKAGDLIWVMKQNIEAVRKAKASGMKYLLINYDELLSSPKEVVDQISQFLHPLELDVQNALSAMRYDSQVGTGIDKSLFSNKQFSKSEYSDFMSAWSQFDQGELNDLGLGFLVE